MDDPHHSASPSLTTRGVITVTSLTRYRLIAGSLLSAVFLSGCVWRSDYDALKQQNDQLQQQVDAQAAQIARLQGAIKYTVNSDLLFESGSWKMKPQGEKIIASFTQKLAPTQQNKIIVKGYTDNQPIGPELQRQGVTSNQELSQKRAEAVMQFLISQGVKPENISAQGFGDAEPVAPNDTPQGRAQNRRVELSLGGPTS
ncbi:MAG: OmpA family protein [Acetobacteraceae bacterium]|nr:OmpA family protein [Acetobacteraceae bacterium]